MKRLKIFYLTVSLLLMGGGNYVLADPISNVSQLSNTKAYTITTARGAWTLNSAGTGIASTHKTSGTVEYDGADQTEEAKRFAIVLYQGFYYAYNLKAGGFLHYDGTGTKISPLMGTPLSFETTGNATYPLKAGTLAKDRYVNNNDGGGIAIDTWTATDDGNRLSIEEAGDMTSEETTAIESALAASPMNQHKAFTIAAQRGTWCANAAGTSLATTATNATPAEGYNQFAFVRFDNNLYIYNVGAKKFIKKDGNLVEGRGDAIIVRLSGDATYPYMFYFPDGPIYFNMQDGGGSYSMNNYSTPDAGNREQITVQDVDAYSDAQTEYNKTISVTYNLMYNGEQVGTTTVTEGLGANSVLPSSLDKGIFTYSYSPKYNQTGAATITVTATPTFTISPDYVGATWYNMYIRQNNRWVPYSESTEPYKPYAATDEDKATKELQWAFVGNPFTTGIKVINRAAGRGKSLAKDGSNAVMRDGETYWDIFGRAGGILLREQNTANNYINQNGSADGNLQFWNSALAATDNGSTLWLVEAPVTTTTVTYNVKYNGSTVKSVTATVVVDDPVPVNKLPAELTPSTINANYFSIAVDDPDHIVAADDEIDITATWNGPFKFSTSFSDAVWYYAKLRGTKYLRADEENKDASNRYTTSATNEQTDVYKWAFVGNPYSIKLMNKGAGSGKYLYMNASSVPVMTDIDPATDEKARWIVAPNGTGFCVRNENGNTNYINDLSGAGNLGIWNHAYGATNEGSRWTVEEIPHQVTYNILYGGDVVATESNVNQLLQEAPVVPNSLKRDFVSYSYDVATVTNSTTTINATATWTGPFEITDDYASAHWYDMAVRSNWYVTSDSKDGDGALKTVESNALGLGSDAYQWAFVGNPYQLKLYNKSEGSTKVYTYVDGSEAIPAFVDASSTNYWKIVRGTRTEPEYENSFMLTIPGTTYRQLNQNGGAGGPLKFWTNGTTSDAGSAFTVFDVPTDFAPYVVSEISPIFETTAEYFVFTDAATTAIGYDAAYKTECTFATYKSLKENIASVKDDIDNYVLPPTGYYRFKNKTSQKYMGLKGTTVYANYTGSDATGAATVVSLTRNDDENKKCSIALQGQYLQAATDSNPVSLDSSPAWFKIAVPELNYGAFSVSGSGRTYLHYKDNYQVVGWEIPANSSNWILEDATTVNISLAASEGHTYATIYVPFGLILPADGGVDAYTVTINGERAQTTNLGKQIPAGTPVILRGATASNTSVTAAIDDDASASVGSNDLQGSYTERALADGELVLGISGTTGIGFYTKGGATPTLSANRAYLPLPAEVKSFTLVFDDEPTGITDHVKVNPAAAKLYDLSGRQVKSGTQKGIFISNGRKVIIK